MFSYSDLVRMWTTYTIMLTASHIFCCVLTANIAVVIIILPLYIQCMQSSGSKPYQDPLPLILLNWSLTVHRLFQPPCIKPMSWIILSHCEYNKKTECKVHISTLCPIGDNNTESAKPVYLHYMLVKRKIFNFVVCNCNWNMYSMFCQIFWIGKSK